MAVRITYAEVVEAGRKAYLEGRLSAQGPTPMCQYRDDSGRPCVIGAALSDEDARYLDGTEGDSQDIGTLVAEGAVKTDDVAGLDRLQTFHDGWASSRDSGHRETCHAELRKLLGIEEGR